jgi:riboflavin biosynthesis pyrimidine reductase
VKRLLPNPGETSVEEQLDPYRPWEDPPADRPRVAMNFVATVDGRATIEGRSGPIGSRTDTAMLAGLRTRFDAVMIGAGTMRVERYGRPVPNQAKREGRERLGLSREPLMVLVSGRLDLPWDAPLFTEGEGEVLIFTASEAEPPETRAPLEVVRHERVVDLREALRHLRAERGVRALLSEGGPRLYGQMQAGGLVDDLFLTISPKLSGGGAPRIIEGELPGVAPLELAWLLEEEGELFARYRASVAPPHPDA